MANNAFYPPTSGGGSGSNASVSAVGAAVPSSGTYIAGRNPSGNLMGVSVDASGDLIVSPLTASSVVTVQSIINALPAGTNNLGSLTNITGTISLPTGASTSANQTTANTSLATIATNTTGVATAANQTTGNTSLATIATNTTGVSTAANQATGNASLATIATNTTGVSTSANQTNGTQKSQIATPTAGTVTQAAITVGTTAVRLTVSGSAPSATRSVLVATVDASSIAKFYVGSSSVTNTGATRGPQIVYGQPFIANSDAGDYWVISDTAGQIVEVMEQA